ncbi:MAG: DUF1080 domain-containing protein [Armatimonadota bacterium]|jgi:hypothetical protein
MGPQGKNIGYDDTPILPGTNWHVHDGTRPQPRVVTPGDPPSDAVVLFDGADFSGWVGKDGGEPQWKLGDGYMETVGRVGNIETREHFGDCQLHLEFACPSEVHGESQGRGNSGVFLMGRYEIQVLDCYENPTYADGSTGAIYGQWPPLVNACKPPGEWQEYDIVWEGPRFEGGSVVRPAFVTVLLNGIVLHHRAELRGVTSHRVVTEYEPHDPVGPLQLQDHGDPVRFRNIWYRPLTGYDEG